MQVQCAMLLAFATSAALGASEDGVMLLQTTALTVKPTVHDVDECYREAEVLDFQMSHMHHNNLGGQGPDSDRQVMRYKKVAVVGDQYVDMVVRAMGPYTANNVKRNGLGGDDAFGAVNLGKGTTVPLKFIFVDSEDDSPVEMKEFYLSFYDIDHEDVESVTLRGFDSYHLVDGHYIKVADLDDGSTSFTATEWGNGENNPTTPDELTDEQLRHSFSALFSSKSEVEVIVGAKKGGGGRNFFFGGGSVACHALRQCSHEPELLDFASASLVQNNLGGQGPDSGEEVIHYSNVAKVDGHSVDLIVSALGPYKSNNIKRNGFGGANAFGELNLYKGTSVPLKFAFVDSHGSPVELDQFYLSFYDVDHEDVESVILKDFDSYHLVDGHHIRVEPMEDDRIAFVATEYGNGENNPSTPETMTAEQLMHSFTVLYTGKSEVLVEVGAKLGGGGRNFFFGGHSVMCLAKGHAHSNFAQIAILE